MTSPALTFGSLFVKYKAQAIFGACILALILFAYLAGRRDGYGEGYTKGTAEMTDSQAKAIEKDKAAVNDDKQKLAKDRTAFEQQRQQYDEAFGKRLDAIEAENNKERESISTETPSAILGDIRRMLDQLRANEHASASAKPATN